jgi:hypothetical protein
MSIETMKQALEALDLSNPRFGIGTAKHISATAALRQAIAEAEQEQGEPVAWYHAEDFKTHFTTGPSEDLVKSGYWQPLYTTPQQRTWVGLTDEEIADCAEKMEASDPTDSFWREFFRGIEAKLMEKNT